VLCEWEYVTRRFTSIALSVREEDEDHVGHFNQWEKETICISTTTSGSSSNLKKLIYKDPLLGQFSSKYVDTVNAKTMSMKRSDESSFSDDVLSRASREWDSSVNSSSSGGGGGGGTIMVNRSPIETITGFSLQQLRGFETQWMTQTSQASTASQAAAAATTTTTTSYSYVKSSIYEDKREARLLSCIDHLIPSSPERFRHTGTVSTTGTGDVSNSENTSNDSSMTMQSSDVLVITSTSYMNTVTRLVMNRSKVMPVSIFLKFVRRISQLLKTNKSGGDNGDGDTNGGALLSGIESKRVDSSSGRYAESSKLKPNELKRGLACCPRLLIFDAVARLHTQTHTYKYTYIFLSASPLPLSIH
jgi:hypothetical protein